MNIVLVRHGDSKQYAFYVPEELLGLVHKGMGVLCKTKYGPKYGTTETGVISGDGARDIALSCGARIPLMPIIGIEHPEFAKSSGIRRAARNDLYEELVAVLSE